MDPDIVEVGDYDEFSRLLKQNHNTTAYDFLTAFSRNPNMILLGIKMNGNEWTEKSFDNVSFSTELSEQ